MKKLIPFYLGLLVIVVSTSTIFSTTIFAAEKTVQVKGLAHPFGTSRYTIMQAIADVHKKANSWVRVEPIETPGSMYMLKYITSHRDTIATGEEPSWLVVGEAPTTIFIGEGRPPVEKVKAPQWVALYSLPSFVYAYVTFDPNIKTLSDLVGKRVGLSEKARVFSGLLANKPLFEKGLGIWDKVDWHWLGEIGSKDALLNKRIDAMQTVVLGKTAIAPDGLSYICTDIAPTEVFLELIESGRELYFIDTEPELVNKSFDIYTDMEMMPVLVKKEAYGSLKRDFWGRHMDGHMVTDITMPQDVLQEMIRVRYEYAKELGKYHKFLEMLPDEPWPTGTPRQFMHPGIPRAFKNLGIPIPKGEVKY